MKCSKSLPSCLPSTYLYLKWIEQLYPKSQTLEGLLQPVDEFQPICGPWNLLKQVETKGNEWRVEERTLHLEQGDLDFGSPFPTNWPSNDGQGTRPHYRTSCPHLRLFWDCPNYWLDHGSITGALVFSSLTFSAVFRCASVCYRHTPR